MLRQIGLCSDVDVAEATEEKFDEAIDAALAEVSRKVSQLTVYIMNEIINQLNGLALTEVSQKISQLTVYIMNETINQ